MISKDPACSCNICQWHFYRELSKSSLLYPHSPEQLLTHICLPALYPSILIETIAHRDKEWIGAVLWNMFKFLLGADAFAPWLPVINKSLLFCFLWE